nr:hypothetical transcript [Hymenolepis microstoma]
MNRFGEFSRILEFLNQPLGQKLFRLKEYKIRYFELEILPNPGGRFFITCPLDYPEKKPMWVVTVGEKLLTCVNVRIPASTVLQAFMFGTFMATKWLEEEMPSDVIQLDPVYYSTILEEPADEAKPYSINKRRFVIPRRAK